MGIITEIRPQKRKVKRSSIFVDDLFVCGLDDFTVFKNKLKVGMEITAEELQTIQTESECNAAFDLALKYISRCAKTQKQMSEYLAGKGYMPELINTVIAKLKEYKYIDDEEYCRGFIEMYKDSWGKRKIKFTLKNRGIDQKIIEEQLDEMLPQTDSALVQAKKYMKNKELDQKNITKLTRHLVGRGYDWEEIGKVLNELKKGILEEQE